MYTLRNRGYFGVPEGGYTVAQGGTVGLEFAKKDILGKPMGLAQTTSQGTINRANVANNRSRDWVTLSGPVRARKNYESKYKITNFGFKRVYNVTSDYGEVRINGDTITFVPQFSGWVSFEVNGRSFNVRCNTDDIQPPSVDKIGFSEIDGGTIYGTTSPFRMLQNEDTHVSSSYQVNDQVNFAGETILDTDGDEVNLTSFEQPGFVLKKTAFVRASYMGADLGMSEWSKVRRYRTPIAIANTAPILGNGILQPMDITLTIPAGGSIRVVTDNGVDTTYTGSQVVTIPIGANILTAVGKGSPGTTIQNPGQPYIAPSGPIYDKRQVWVPPVTEQSKLEWVKVGNSRATHHGPTLRPALQAQWNAETTIPLPAATRVGQTATKKTKDSIHGGDLGADGQLYYAYFVWHTDYIVERVITRPAAAGYYRTETYRSGWENPGQPKIDPYTEYTTGLPSTLAMPEQILTFPGGHGGEAELTTKLQRLIILDQTNQTGTIAVSEAKLTIPAGGSLQLVTDNGFDQTYTANATVSIPAGVNILTAHGKGGPGTTVQNPGQSYIAPSGPIYDTRQVWVEPVEEVRELQWQLTADNSDGYGFQTEAEMNASIANIEERNPDYSTTAPEGSQTIQRFVNVLSSNPNFPYAYHLTERIYTRVSVIVTPAADGYYKSEQYQTGWTNPGRPYIAAWTDRTTGPSTILEVVGQTIDFPGGYGGDADITTKLQRMLVGSGGQAGTDAPVPATVVVPTGGSLRIVSDNGFSQTYTANATINIPAGGSILTLDGKGGPGTTTQDPGQPYIAPSGPVYGTRDVWVPDTAAVTELRWVHQRDYYQDSWHSPAEVDSAYNHIKSRTYYGEADPSRSPPTVAGSTYEYTLNVTEPVQKSGSPLGEAYNMYMYVTYRVYEGKLVTVTPAIAGYWKQESYVTHYTDPGQPHIPASTVRTTGPETSISLQGKKITFTGGYGGPGTDQSKFHYLIEDVAPNSGFGTTTSVDRSGRFLVVGTPRSETTSMSQVGSVTIFDLGPTGYTLRQKYYSENPPSSLSFVVPTGGSLRVKTDNGFEESTTASGTFNLPAGLKVVEIYAKGAAGTTTSNPGQPYIAPSGPVYDQREVDVWIDTVPGNWGSSTLPIMMFNWGSLAEADAGRSAWLAGSNASVKREAQVASQHSNDPSKYGFVGFEYRWIAEVPGYWGKKTELIFLYWSNPGQPHIAPFTEKVKGDPVVVNYVGKSLTFPGGEGGPAEETSQTITNDVGLSLGASVFITPDSNRVFSGAPNDRDVQDNAGVVFDFEKSAEGYLSVPTRIATPSPVQNGLFGYQLCANKDGSRLFVSAVGENSVYYFKREAGTLVFKQRIKAQDTTSTDFFGENLACDDLGDTLIIGAPNKPNGTNAGVAYVFGTTDGESFVELKKFTPNVGYGSFTYDVKDGGELVVEQIGDGNVSLKREELTGTGTVTLETGTRLLRTRGRGAVSANDNPTTLSYDGVVHRYNSAPVGLPTEVFADIPRFSMVKNYGCDVDISANGARVIIGASKATSMFSEQGAVFIYDKKTNGWEDTPRLVSREPSAEGAYGIRVAMADSPLRFVVGDPGGHNGVGLLNIVTETTTNNRDSFNTFYTSPIGEKNFGREVAISGNGDIQVASNPVIDDNKGYVYVFNS